jgi:hypothetical protein
MFFRGEKALFAVFQPKKIPKGFAAFRAPPAIADGGKSPPGTLRPQKYCKIAKFSAKKMAQPLAIP